MQTTLMSLNRKKGKELLKYGGTGTRAGGVSMCKMNFQGLVLKGILAHFEMFFLEETLWFPPP